MGCGSSQVEDPLESGRQFLESISQEDNVHKLPSGMYFKILTPTPDADGMSPTASDPCKVHYHGTFTSGKKFDSSMDRGKPSTFAPNEVIKGWTEALQLMTEGEQWEVYLPHELAYGARGAGDDIPGYSTLVFKIHLIKVLKGGKPGSQAHAKLEKLTGHEYSELY
ncbi:FKBP-type peptidyl-prolyl cis-trans isomerase, putative [Angomonas deanei]|uniref:peptidylprolyl isomerase n=1 Tax=Angomonas deanei TaxID=59799 RepID=A0A7G2CW04_9TRYP|nr:FKBP-type peptidyl-prolyl cis-trans isomerase, putative [Angomonas deanei]